MKRAASAIVKLGLMQTDVSANPAANLQKTILLVERAAKSGAKIQTVLHAGDGSQLPVHISMRPVAAAGGTSTNQRPSACGRAFSWNTTCWSWQIRAQNNWGAVIY
ncbi:MAG: hypothetical protein WCJ07_02495, partial [Verrucomicrobiota bacterium]